MQCDTNTFRACNTDFILSKFIKQFGAQKVNAPSPIQVTPPLPPPPKKKDFMPLENITQPFYSPLNGMMENGSGISSLQYLGDRTKN